MVPFTSTFTVIFCSWFVCGSAVVSSLAAQSQAHPAELPTAAGVGVFPRRAKHFSPGSVRPPHSGPPRFCHRVQFVCPEATAAAPLQQQQSQKGFYCTFPPTRLRNGLLCSGVVGGDLPPFKWLFHPFKITFNQTNWCFTRFLRHTCSAYS